MGARFGDIMHALALDYVGDHPDRYRQRATELRTWGLYVRHTETMMLMQRLAESYDLMAQATERRLGLRVTSSDYQNAEEQAYREIAAHDWKDPL